MGDLKDRWRDMHRHYPSGRFLPRPGAKGFKESTPKSQPKEDDPDAKPKPGLSLWVNANKRGG